MTFEERDALVEAFQQPPYKQFRSWTFHYDSGDFLYDHPHQGVVYFTPDAEEPGAVSIDIIDAGGNSQGSGRIPFTSMRAEDLFGIVRPFLRPQGGRKNWDPRVTALGAPDPQSSEEDLVQELQSYMSGHDSFDGESYEFNIRLGIVNIPEDVQQNVAQRIIDEVVQVEMDFRLRDFVIGLKADFPWIYEWAQAGRSSGWLVLQPDYGVMDEDATIPDLAKARSRLEDLEKISRLVKEGVRELESDLATTDLWAEVLPQFTPTSKKHWDPREPQK